MYSLQLDGKVLDYQFKKQKQLGFGYLFFTGDIYQGQVFNTKRGWTALASDSESRRCQLVKGFRSRLDAAEYILQANGYRDDLPSRT